MKIRTTQLIDYWIGIPLCLLFSLWRVLADKLFPRRAGPVKRALFIELSEMGSAILAHSSLVKFNELYPECEQYFLIFNKNRESVEVLGVIPKERILVIDERSFATFLFSALRTLLRIRSLAFDTAIDLELFSRCTTLISYLSGAARRVGFHNFTAEGLYRGDLLTHKVYYNVHQHMALNFLALVRSLQQDTAELPQLKADLRGDLRLPPRHHIAPVRRDSMLRLLAAEGLTLAAESKLVVINPDPGALLPIRGWPLERFSELANEILRLDRQVHLAIMGVAGSESFAEAIISTVPAADKCRVVNFVGKTKSLIAVLDLLSVARALITNDSGPAHLASLTAARIVVFFGPETPALYAPLGENVAALYSSFACSPCLSAANHRRTVCRNNRCLQAIAVRDALEALTPSLL